MGPLVGLLIGLGKQALDEQQKAAEEERAARHQAAQVQADIKAKRASRAGDAGYIQQAFREAEAFPTSSNASGGKALLALGSGLLQQKAAGDAEDAAAAGGDGWDIDNEQAPSFAPTHRTIGGGYW